jgi:ribosomal-protein-alanine N-acetyltransferase
MIGETLSTGVAMVIAETQRLILRQFTSDDLDAIAAILADAVGMKYIGRGVPLTRDVASEWLSRWLANGRYDWSAETLARVPQLLRAPQRNAHFSMWAMIDKSDGALIGRSGLLAWNLDGQLEVEVGYHLARSHWGKGLATEAATAVRDYGMTRLGFDRLVSVIMRDNLASQRVAVKIGMRHEKDTIVKETPVRLFSMNRLESGHAGI